jgi:hypothetical protein
MVCTKVKHGHHHKVYNIESYVGFITFLEVLYFSPVAGFLLLSGIAGYRA